MPIGMTRYHGKAWNEHFLPRLSTIEVQQLVKDDALVVLPVGAIEQHGPHMPVFTDTLIAEAYLTEAFELLPDDANIWLLPALPFGKSTEHLGHPGTISLSAETMMRILMDIGNSLRVSGFRKLLLFNTHGGNTDLLNMMAREIRVNCGLDVYRLDPGGLEVANDLLDEVERKVGIHAGDQETSLVMAIKRPWVHDELAPCELPQFPETPYLGFRKKSFAWVMNDISNTGIAGDATKATEHKGKLILESASKIIAEALLGMAAFDMSSIRSSSVATANEV